MQMVRSVVIRVVDFCARYPWPVFILGALLAASAAVYDVTRFSINTDTENLIARDLPWRQRQTDFEKAFPQMGILVVVTAPTLEQVAQATDVLQVELAKHTDLFESVLRPESGTFFQQNGLLFEPLQNVTESMASLSKADVLVDTLAGDPSLRGVLTALNLAVGGVEGGQVKLSQLEWPLLLSGRVLSDVLAGKLSVFSWQALVQGAPPPVTQLRRFIEVQPVLEFSALQPGRKATDGIRRAAADLKLNEMFGATVQLTGTVPINDDQFSVIQESASRDTISALLGTLIILWMALRSWKIVLAVTFGVLVGLAATTALGLVLLGSFNLLSIAFFVLFVGLGVDFGIQLSVRYRSERHLHDDLHEALRRAASEVAMPLTLAAAATAVAFFSFLPTSYKGLSELGLIAGCGMLIAFLCSITLVPAVLALLSPPGEVMPVGFARLAPLDDFLQRHRAVVIAGTFLMVIAGAPLLFRLPFDFNPIDLQNPNAPSVVTYREIQDNPLTGGSDAEVVTKSIADAESVAKRLAALPQVLRALTLNSLIPDDQEQKIAAIRAAGSTLRKSLDEKRDPAPADADTIDAIRATAANLTKVSSASAGRGADAARNLSSLLTRLAQSDMGIRQKAERAFVPSLIDGLDHLRDSLGAAPVTLENLPTSLVRNWLLPDGRARVQIMPKGDANDAAVLRAFATSVLSTEPSATGPAISLYESGRTVIRAFAEAGAIALAAIALLLFIALKRAMDVLLTLIPLLLAGLVTLEICSITNTVLNFANIIALPLLLGVGVAFKIYFILAWREGRTHLLETALTRAVVFSALTNAVAFGSMWSSKDPGLSSMGRMMALALVCTMAAAVLFQPVLMGRPRQIIAPKPGTRFGIETAEQTAEDR
ncbi:MMPL family transporter [Tardiphaga sp. 862_B3_N4_1]|uniref:hopanoid transporter HpnN n=1 Tax=Tardiphaga sp. 862_B3_N4_1 TaxID=3240764 RepID=UPI003F264F6D